MVFILAVVGSRLFSALYGVDRQCCSNQNGKMVNDDCKLSCLLAHLIHSAILQENEKNLLFKLFLNELLAAQCNRMFGEFGFFFG